MKKSKCMRSKYDVGGSYTGTPARNNGIDDKDNVPEQDADDL